MDKTFIAFIFAVLATIFGIFNIAVALSKLACEVRWADSGFSVKHSAFGGCRIQLKDGTWIPAANYRDQ